MKRYPMLSNWVTIKDYRFGNVLITNELTGKSYTADQKCLAFLKMLDGKTNPYAMSYPYERGWSRADVEAMLDEFTKFGLIR